MKYFFVFYSLVLCVEFGATFFLFPEKKLILYCLKVCPLYCAKRQKRDTGPYWDPGSSYDWPPYYEDEDDQPYHSHHSYHPHGRWFYCKPKSTTTAKPTTTTTKAPTTEEPTFICQVCQKKCGFPNE